MFALVLALALAAPLTRPSGPSLNKPQGSHIDPNHPTFEFALADGRGMGTSCACAAVTGINGEVMTFSRASSGTCLKTVGTTLANIANGDMVTCTSGQPRVMPGPDGTTVLGLLVEQTRTNWTIRSQEFDNGAVWQSEQSAVSAPVVTANVATAPDGTLTADRLQVPATTGGNYSHIYSNSACPSATETASLFIRAHDGASSGTLDLEVQGGTQICTPCTYVGTAWTRCTLLSSSTNSLMTIGSSKVYSGCSGAAADVDIWGAQCEVGAYATSYIATTSATVTRAAELADFPVTFGAGTTGFSLASTVVLPNSFANQPILGAMIGDGALGGAGSANYLLAQASGSAAVLAQTTGAGTPTTFTSALTALTGGHRYAIFHTGALLNACLDGTCGAGAAGTYSAPTLTRLRIGNYSATLNVADAVTKQVCLDASSTRCR